MLLYKIFLFIFIFLFFLIFCRAILQIMENLNLTDLNLLLEESRDIIEFLARKEILKTINVSRAMNCCAL